ncbi:hypothetical protein WMF18_27740 [Sorangium sp. So ce315]|uniref:hypothetical protein n=1 Tax=Sorangium sp. So ce315 TaxID=3133299 RepID=UPI003F61816C
MALLFSGASLRGAAVAEPPFWSGLRELRDVGELRDRQLLAAEQRQQANARGDAKESEELGGGAEIRQNVSTNPD